MNLEKIKELIMQAARNEIRVTYEKPDSPIAPCASKIGGKPDVPKDFEWPEYEGKGCFEDEAKKRPLSFLAQINLKDIAECDTENLLPHEGILSFFYDLDTMQWGFDPSDKGCARVYLFNDENVLSVRDFPDELDEEFILPELKICMEKHISIQDYRDYPLKPFDLEWDDYDKCCSECGYEYDEWGDVTKLLGYPDVIQKPMEERCESVTRGYRRGSPEDYSKIPESELADIKEAASQWTLLFQMGTVSVDDYELMFGDCGHIYFWIKKQDLAERNFDNIWLILQCG